MPDPNKYFQEIGRVTAEVLRDNRLYIERLESQVERYRAALEHYADEHVWQQTDSDRRNGDLDFLRPQPVQRLRREYINYRSGFEVARTALKEEKE